MSPEQAEMNQLDVDTRCDVYSLGVVLYELLTGTTPIHKQQIKQADLLETLRMIRDDDPPRPSTRLSTAETLATLSEQRRTEPAKLARLVRGDLDWIVMKALEKDRDRRYASAALLAQDIEHYLNDEPVEASPPSTGYRLRKFVRRHRGAVVAGALLLVTLLAGIAATAFGLVEARQQRDQAEAAGRQERDQRQRAETNEKRARDEEAAAQDLAAQLQKETREPRDCRAACPARFPACRPAAGQRRRTGGGSPATRIRLSL